jgi:hypothetical protein
LKKDSKIVPVVMGQLLIGEISLQFFFIRSVDDPEEKLEIPVKDFGLGEYAVG